MDVFEQLRSEMPALIFRDKISEYGLNPRTMSNHDCKGTGPKEKVRIGRRIAYGRDSLIVWLKARQRKSQ